jgi:hypothetical protein
MSNDKNVPPEWRYVKMDETQFWDPDCPARLLGKRLVATYAYNKGSHTYCCSLTPAYWLVYLGTEYNSEAELSEEEKELIDSSIRESETEDQSGYWNCSDIDRLVSHPLPYPINVDREDFPQEREYDRKVEEDIRESFYANPC